MNFLLKLTCLLFFFFRFLPGFAQEKQNDHLMISESRYGFAASVSRLETLLKQNQAFSLFIKIDDLEPAGQTCLLIFGNPKLGTLWMQKDQLSGLDLPLKMMVYKNENKTKITYSSINYLQSRYDFKGVNSFFKVKKDLKKLASKASGMKVKKSGKLALITHQGIISEISDFDFKTTYQRLLKAIENNPDLDIIKEIDHFKNAKKVNMGLRPTSLIIFGTAKVGPPVIKENRKIALEFPAKILVWQDEAGVVKISYNNPAFLLQRFNIIKDIPEVHEISNTLEKLSKHAAKY